jgi:hypothetical protein
MKTLNGQTWQPLNYTEANARSAMDSGDDLTPVFPSLSTAVSPSSPLSHINQSKVPATSEDCHYKDSTEQTGYAW